MQNNYIPEHEGVGEVVLFREVFLGDTSSQFH